MIPKKILDRKIKLNLENTLIIGPKSVGKSFLIFNFLSTFKGKYNYINCNFPIPEIDNSADLIIYDNYQFKLPILKDKTYFITSSKNINIKGFKKVFLDNLDFEEFFSFDKSISINQSFNKFLKTGNFPYTILNSDDFVNKEYIKERFELLPYDKTLLKFLFSHIGEKFTLYQIYQILKKETKISKDTLYSQIKEMLNDRVIFEVPKFNHPKSPKKFFAYNFIFKQILTNSKNLLLTFENIIFLEIKEQKPFYKNGLNFYLPDNNFGIMVIPFANEEIVKAKLKQIDDKLSKLLIITISNEFKIDCKKVEVEVLPFWKWRFAE